MKKFFVSVFAAMMGFFLSLGIILFLGFIMMAAAIATSDSKPNLKDNTVLHIKLNGAVTEDTAPGGYAVLQLAEGEWDISGNGEMPLSYDAVVSATSSPLNGEKVLTVCFVVGWAQ